MGLVTAAAVMPPQSPVGHGDLREGIESLLDLMTTTSRLNRSLPAGEMPSLQIAANWQPYEAGMLRAWAAVKQEDVTPRSCVKSDAKASDLQRRLAPQSQASPVGSPPPSNILAKPDKAKEPCPHPGCSNVFAMVMARVHPDGHSKHYLAHVASCKHAPCANPAVKQEDDCDVVRTPPGNVIVGQHAVVQGATCRLDAPAVSRSMLDAPAACPQIHRLRCERVPREAAARQQRHRANASYGAKEAIMSSLTHISATYGGHHMGGSRIQAAGLNE